MHDYMAWAQTRFRLIARQNIGQAAISKRRPTSSSLSLSLANQEIMVDDKGSHFKAMFPYIFAEYQNPLLTEDFAMANKAWQIWQNTPFSWWQCQLTFALWCASAGCGVSFEDHLQAEKPLLASLYRFHVYRTTKRLLEELRVALPGDKSHSWYKNPYNSWAYKRLCFEFGVSLDTEWRQKVDHECSFMAPTEANRHAHVAQGPFFHSKDAMRHNRDISGAWTTFVLDKSDGFTQAGVDATQTFLRVIGESQPSPQCICTTRPVLRGQCW